MESKKKDSVIDLGKLFRLVFKNKRRFFIVWIVTAIASYLLVLGVPRYYVADAKLVPEIGSDMPEGTLGSLASSFGFDLGSLQSNDAISPLLYPDLMDDNAFVASLLNIHVKSLDGKIDTDYYSYLKKHQKAPWWTRAIDSVTKLFKKKDPAPVSPGQADLNPYQLPKNIDDALWGIRNSITVTVDKKTGVIGVVTKAQDPLICKTVTDSMIVKLQSFIIDYRTNKAHNDEKYYEQLTQEALQQYEEARWAYARFADSHTNAVMNTYRTTEESMQNDMQLKYTTYTTMSAQLQQARAKVQERTPAFTLLKGAAVPFKPAGPKRMMFVIFMLFLATFATIIYLLKDDIKELGI